MDELASFGPWLRRQRKGRYLTQDALARQVGCALITIQKIEADERRPSLNISTRLADILDVPGEERARFLKVARGELAVDHLEDGRALWHPVAPPLHNLPTPPNPLIGRTYEVESLLELVRRPDVRLITLTGPGGTGKTRLAVQVATEVLNHFTDGIRFVALAPLSDPALVLPTIAHVLGVRQVVGSSLHESLETALRGRHLLLVLDNFEQVIDAGLDLAALLIAAPQLSVLVTSRASLHLSGEQEFAVPPLALPISMPQMPARQLTQYAAVALFIARAQAKRRDFHVTDATAPAIGAICIRLDGLPLAIELAAARCKALTPEAILARLEHRLDLLTGGARDLPTRQQTMRATMDWSYNLLDAREQQMFSCLAVFTGSWTLEAAEAVCAAHRDSDLDVLDGLQTLVDSSLVQDAFGVDGEPRFTMLETMREYARERLEASGEMSAVQDRHAQYVLEWATTPPPARGPWEQRARLDRLEQELHNVRTTLHFLIENRQATAALRLAAALVQFWETRGNQREGRAWIVAALALDGEVAPVVRANAQLALSDLSICVSTDRLVIAMLEESLELFTRIGDKPGMARAYLQLGHTDKALRMFEELGDQHGITMAVYNHGYSLRFSDPAAGRAALEEALVNFRERRDTIRITNVLENLGGVATEQKDFGAARAWLAEGLALARQIGYTNMIAGVLHAWGEMNLLEGDDATARSHLEEAAEVFRTVGNKFMLACVLHNLGYVSQHSGDVAGMVTNVVEAMLIFQELEEPGGIEMCLGAFAGVAVQQTRPERAGRLFGAAEALLATFGGIHRYVVHKVEIERNVAQARTQVDQATFAAAWADGEAMTMEEAIAYALDDAN